MNDQSFDDILTTLGTGKWNWLYFVAVSSCTFWLPSIIISATYVAPKLDFICDPSPMVTNITDVNKCSYDTQIYNVSTGELETVEHSCTKWIYNQSDVYNSMTSEFNLVCEKAYLRPIYTTAYMFGNIVGSPVNGVLSDRFGRKPIIVLTTFLGIVSVLVSFAFQDMMFIVIARFVTGFGFHSMLLSSFTLFIEVCEQKYRSVMGIYFSLPWAFGTMWWGVLGYLIRDWRWLQSASVAPSIVMVICLCLFDESPRWLIVNGKFNEALKVLKKAAKWNGANLPNEENLMEKMEKIQKSSLKTQSMSKEDEAKNKNENQNCSCLSPIKSILPKFMVLFKTPELRKITLLMYLMFFVAGMVYYGLSLSAVNLDLNPYMYIVVVGITQIPSYTLTGNIIGKFGRVPPTAITFLGSGVAILALAFIPNEPKWPLYIFVCVGSICIATAFQIIFLSANEVFPTEVRLQGFGTSSFLSSFGGGIAPFITDSLGSYFPWVPSLVFGSLSILAALATIFTPETLNKNLPETIDILEAKAIEKKSLKSNVFVNSD